MDATDAVTSVENVELSATHIIWVQFEKTVEPAQAVLDLAKKIGAVSIEPITVGPFVADQYWTRVAAEAPDQIESALVIPVGAEITLSLARLHPFLEERIAAVFPLSMVHAHSHALMNSQAALNLSAAELDIWLNRYAVGKAIEVPTLAGLSGWVDFQTLRACSGGDDRSLEAGLRLAGQSMLVSDEAFVDDSQIAPFIDPSRSLPQDVADALATRHPFTKIRHPLGELNGRSEAPPPYLEEGPGAILNVSHSWGGGLARWINDFAEADGDHISLTLRSVGNKDVAAHSLALYMKGQPVPLQQWSLTTPILSSAVGSAEYRRVLAEIMVAFPIRAVVVSTLIGHSLDLYRLGLPVIHVLHDFFPWCPPLYAHFESPCTQCDSDRLTECLEKNKAHEFFRNEPTDYFIGFREHLLNALQAGRVSLVAPTESVRSRWQQLAPGLQSARIDVIGHGLPKSQIKAFRKARWQPDAKRKPHVLILGSLAKHKGGDILLKALPDILEDFDVTLLGCGDSIRKFPSQPGLTVKRWYQLHELPELLADIKPDLGLLLSVVPETFSYTLSELYAAAVPPIATHLGAFVDRVAPGETGWLIEPKKKALLKQLAVLAKEPGSIETVKNNLLAMHIDTTKEVAKRYLALLPDHDAGSQPRPLAKSVLAPQSAKLGSSEPLPAALVIPENSTYRMAMTQFLDYSLARLQQVTGVRRLFRPFVSLPLRVLRRLARP